MRVLAEEITGGITELVCHPGYPGPDLRSSYRVEREWELRTLCDPRIRRFLVEREIALVAYGDAMRLLGTPASPGS
jgi:predicted glycoside hydrolase/deacetylase ChbG (UPF0249 family)